MSPRLSLPDSQESFWTGVPRAGFSALCIRRFGMGFEGERISPLSAPQVPPGRVMTRTYPSTREANTQRQRTPSGLRANTAISQRAMQSGSSLIG